MRNKIYKYTNESAQTIFVPFLKGIYFDLTWLKCVDGLCTAKKGYKWDGCSPKFRVFGRIIGTPDGKNNETKNASMWHDVFYQYKRYLTELGVKRKDVDLFFLHNLQKSNWKYSKTYYIGVRVFGGFYGSWDTK